MDLERAVAHAEAIKILGSSPAPSSDSLPSPAPLLRGLLLAADLAADMSVRSCSMCAAVATCDGVGRHELCRCCLLMLKPAQAASIPVLG